MENPLAARVMARLRRLPSGYYACAAIAILLAIVVVNAMDLATVRQQWGEDYRFFMAIAERWRTGASVYLPHQLAGPYVELSGRDMIYPPIALLLFVPLSFLPAPLWWIIPLGTIAAVIIWFRPEAWTWPVFALALWYPRDESMIIWGNTGMWMAALVGLGLVWGWPAAFVLLKPSLAPFLLAGIRKPRALVVGLVVLAALSLTMVPLWADFITAVRNAGSSWPSVLYSLPDVPLLLMPALAWMARTRGRRQISVTGPDAMERAQASLTMA
ncbi:MAG TPA: glycosyltransferase family 87 protein [Candidatus Limnocylindrales bacterium]|nr:glycosyltransferase family 87 protein [Candidatus Limnocylindrales bacterium]